MEVTPGLRTTGLREQLFEVMGGTILEKNPSWKSKHPGELSWAGVGGKHGNMRVFSNSQERYPTPCGRRQSRSLTTLGATRRMPTRGKLLSRCCALASWRAAWTPARWDHEGVPWIGMLVLERQVDTEADGLM